jgi:type VI protein secretion system component VasF
MHLTYHDSDTHTGAASTAKAEEAGAPDMEITRAMIDAGAPLLLAFHRDRGPDAEETVNSIYRAMVAARYQP